jgi:hypothetical protein
MPTYTVHAPPPKAGEATSDPQRFVFIRDGFHFWAFLFAPLWLLVHRLWLAFAGYAGVVIIGGLALRLIDAPRPVHAAAAFLVALLVGFEATSLWRWTLTRRGWRAHGFVVGDDQESAERRFFGEWAKRSSSPPAAAETTYATPVRRGAPSGSDVIGLFPEPGGSP